MRRRAEQLKLLSVEVLGFDPECHVLQTHCTMEGKQVAPEFRAFKCHCHQDTQQGCADVLASVHLSRQRTLCCTWQRCLASGLLSLCYHGSCPLHLGQTTVHSPCLQYPMSTVRARQLQVPRAVTWKLQIDETRKHLGISCVVSCWLISQCLLKGSTFRKAEHVCCWSGSAAGCRNSEQKSKLVGFWCNFVSRTENLSRAYHIVVKKNPKESNICLSCNW